MIKYRYIAMLLLIAACMVTSSCTVPEKRPLKEEVNIVVNKIQAVFDLVKKNVLSDRDHIEYVYNNRDAYDLTIHEMDVDDGGKYTVSDNGIYHKPVDDGLCSWYYGFGMPDESVKREIRLLENIEEKLKVSVESVHYNKYATFISDWVYVVYPFYNIIKVFPPAYSFAYLREKYKENEPVWKKLSKGGSYRYCDFQIIVPVYFNDSYMGIASLSISIPEIAKPFLIDNNRIIMMLSHDYWVLGVSRLCKKKFKLASVDSSDYFTGQLQEEEYSLLMSYRPEGFRELAEKIRTYEREFTQEINDTLYNVVVIEIPEIRYYIVGLEKQ